MASEQVFYKLSELSKLLEVESSVLRFWEKEFPHIKPLQAGPRKRLYRPQDLAAFAEIKRLLYEERYTIAGARQRLAAGGEKTPEAAELAKAQALLAETRRELQAIRDLLAAGQAGAAPTLRRAPHKTKK